MQSNTAEIGNHPVSFSSFSVEKKRCGSDPFMIRDGRYFGNDGFVVPKNFPEFFKRFPDYVQRWISKHAPASASEEDKEDWTQDLLIHLSRLPLTSKYRETGKEDIVQTFDPMKHYGANEARFRNYINLCIANKFRRMYFKRMNDAQCRPGNLSLTADWEDTDCSQADDEFCHAHSVYLQRAAKASEKQVWDRTFVGDFVNFVRREDPKILSAIEAILATATRADAADWLGITENEFGRKRTRLRLLAESFQRGEPVPRQRRPYKKRVLKDKQFPASRLAA